MLQAGTDPEQSEFNAEYGPYLNFLGCMLVAFPLVSYHNENPGSPVRLIGVQGQRSVVAQSKPSFRQP